MPSIAIIPARGGSKRIPRKNIKNFLGKPIIAYSIEAAINSNLFNQVMLSTDDNEIASIALKYGAKVPFLRSKKNSNDFATTYDVIEETLLKYKELGNNFDFACCIYSCAPLIQIASLKEAFTVLKKNVLDTVFPVVPFSFPIQRALKLKEEKLSFFNPEFALTRSQDLEVSYHDAGQFYFMNCESVLKKKALLTDKTGAVVLDD